ncbi:MAG: VaFE repeat-containing surface-anchored protein [Clostridiales bacterium]|nr:VaFE repeat-containing surface-anchored protein [Clostridiales bacterium]
MYRTRDRPEGLIRYFKIKKRNEESIDMNITKRKSKIFTMLIAIIMMVGIFIPSVSDRAYAADGRITVKVGKQIDYSSHFTHYFYAGEKDHPVYCAQPQLPTLPSGTYDYNFISPTSMLAKCLYYGFGGPGYDKYIDDTLRGSWDGEDDAYCLTHIIISIAYDETTSASVDPFYGLTGTWKSKAQSLYNYIKSLPAPPVNYRAYIIKSTGCQDILGSFNDTGNIKIVKSSKDTAMTDSNTCYSLAGAKYGVYYGSSLIGTITTDASGIGTLNNVLVANYTLKEITASKGYALDIRSYNCNVKNETTTTVGVKEQPKDDPIGILLKKGDGETDKPAPQGGGVLQGAVYEVKYYKHTSSGKSLAATWRFITDKNGIAHFSEADLDKSFDNSDFYISAAGDPCMPLGTVTVQEVKAPEGYLLNDRIYTTVITEDAGTVESVYTYNTPEIGSDAEVAEQPKRGDIKLVKVKDGTMQRLSNIQFKITSKTTGESHIVCTDENGIIDTSSSWNSHESDTNGGTSLSGVWFGEISAIDDNKGALLYDYYTLDEIRGENNKNMRLLEDVEFRIYRDSTVLNLGTVTDDVIKIKTEALDKETKNHISYADNKVTIIDTVSYKNLTEGKIYKMKGMLIDKETGKPLIVDEKKITSEKEFLCKDENGSIELEFTFDATSYSGIEVVVFEKCFDVEAEAEITGHEDIEDKAQSISIPKIKTKAIGKASKLNIVSNAGKQRVIDTVSYEKLLPGEQYLLKTWLVDSKGFPILDAPSVAKEFTVNEENGEVDTEISFDSGKFSSQNVVIFEELYIINKDTGKKEIVATHKDIKDSNQTIKVPKIGTTAKVSGSKENTIKPKGEHQIVDTIKYENLISEKEYKAKTYLVDADGKKIKGTDVETIFTADKENGSVDVKIVFDAEKIKTQKIVVFEEIYLMDDEEEILIGEHKDINDDNQTVKILVDTPKTGDKNLVWLFAILAVIAGSGIFAALKKNERRRKKE